MDIIHSETRERDSNDAHIIIIIIQSDVMMR